MCFPGFAIKAGAVAVLSSARVLQHFERVGEVEENNNSSLQIRSQFLRGNAINTMARFSERAGMGNIKNAPKFIQQIKNPDFDEKETEILRENHNRDTKFAQNRIAKWEANFRRNS